MDHNTPRLHHGRKAQSKPDDIHSGGNADEKRDKPARLMSPGKQRRPRRPAVDPKAATEKKDPINNMPSTPAKMSAFQRQPSATPIQQPVNLQSTRRPSPTTTSTN